MAGQWVHPYRLGLLWFESPAHVKGGNVSFPSCCLDEGQKGKGEWQLLCFQKSNIRKGSHPVRLHSYHGPGQYELACLTSSAHMLCGLALRPVSCHAAQQQILDLLVALSELRSVPCGGQRLCSEGEPTYPSDQMEEASHASNQACHLEQKLLSSGTSLLIFKIVEEWGAEK